MDICPLTNTLITGGSGMIGSHLDFGYKPSSSEMDITSASSIQAYIQRITNISCIIHLAALNLRDSEKDARRAIDVNINGTINMLHVARTRNIPFILVSTGAVFSSFNSNMNFSETSLPNPNCIYGCTKYTSEQIALAYPKTLLLRTGWLFGGNQKTHYKFVEHIYNNICNSTAVSCCNNFYGSTTYVVDFIERMKYLISTEQFGIYHVVNSGISTGLSVGLKVADILKKPHSLIESRSFTSIPNCGPERSLTEVLVTNHSMNTLRPWQDALDEYIHTLMVKSSYTPTTTPVTRLFKNRDRCRLCTSVTLLDIVNLEPSPPANHFLQKPAPQEYIPLDVCICRGCNHVQLRQTVDPQHLYSDYFYVSSTSGIMTQHLKTSVMEFIQASSTTKDDAILEIGANDGVCIQELLDRGFTNILGVDPAKNIHTRHSLPILCDFFGSGCRDEILRRFPSFRLIYAFHCMAHIEDIQDVFSTIYELLDDTGVFVMEVGYLYDVYKNNIFDVIYHEHIDYHTCTALDSFSKRFGLVLFNVERNTIQGGSIQAYFSKDKKIQVSKSVTTCMRQERDIGLFDIDTLKGWTYSIKQICFDVNNIINAFINSGKTIAGFGASAKSTTFLHALKIRSGTLKYIIDDNIYKQGHYSPGLHIPIKPLDTLRYDKVDYVLILSCNFAEELINKLDIYRKTGMRIIVPFPEIRIL